MFHLSNLCTRCYRCISVCPTGSTQVGSGGEVVIDREKCKVCGKCVEACPNEARVVMGKEMSLEEVFDTIKKDSLFFRNSGGGVTFSGGEPTQQIVYLRSLLKLCGAYGFHIALETCGYVAWEVLKSILGDVDLILYDLKHIDPIKHKQLTGVENQIILSNLQQIVKLGQDVVVRIPFIPGCNDSHENIEAVGMYLREIGQKRVDLIPYHRLGEGKYRSLGLHYKLEGVAINTEENVQRAVMALKNFGLDVEVI